MPDMKKYCGEGESSLAALAMLGADNPSTLTTSMGNLAHAFDHSQNDWKQTPYYGTAFVHVISTEAIRRYWVHCIEILIDTEFESN